MKTGLVLEGGAMRGMFTAGVTDVMMENNIDFDGIVGVSAGAAFGCNYKSRQIGRALRYNTKFCKDKRYCSLYSLITSGNLYNTDFCYNQVPCKYDLFDFDTYQKNPTKFYVVCTDIEKGEAVYQEYDGRESYGFDLIRASASMPLVSQIVTINNRKLLDGGIADSIPIRFLEREGYQKNLVVLTRPMGYTKKKNHLIPIIKIKYSNYPKLIDLMKNRHERYNETLSYIEEKERKGQILVIRPPAALPVTRTEKDPEKLKAAYNIGRETAKNKMNDIKKYLGI